MTQHIINYTMMGANLPVVLIKKPLPHLFVMFSSAINRKNMTPPVFNRIAWADNFPGSVLYIFDPTVMQSDTLDIAWYIGRNNYNAMDSVVDFVVKTAASLGVTPQNIIAYGSSGGGFAALMLSCRIKNSVAIAISPQVQISRYIPRIVNAFLQECFEGMSIKEAENKFADRFIVVAAIRKLNKNARFLIVQNKLDLLHYNEHFLPFAEEFKLPFDGGYSVDKTKASYVYEDPRGHVGERKEMVVHLIELALMLDQVE